MKVPGWWPHAPHHAGVLRARSIDEARLADAVREELLEVGQRGIRLLDDRFAVTNPVQARARSLIELREGRVVSEQQIDRAGSFEIVLERGDLLLDALTEHALLLPPRSRMLNRSKRDARGEEQATKHDGE